MQESTRTPLSQFGQNRISSEEKGYCFTDSTDVKSSKHSSSNKKKLFSTPKFVASLVTRKKSGEKEMEMYSPKKTAFNSKVSLAQEKKGLKQIEVIEENPYVMEGVNECESYSSLNDQDQDQKVFIDVQNANMLNIFRQRKQTPNFTEHNIGPRFTNDGKVIKRSIVGKPDAFLKMQNVLFKNNNEIMQPTVKDSKSPIRNPPSKEKTNQFNKSLTSIHSMSSLNEDGGGETKKKKGAPSTISTKRPGENETGKFHVMTRIGKDELVQDIDRAEQRQVANTENDKLLLNTLPAGDKRFFTKEQRILDRFQKTKDIWERKAQTVAQKVRRKVETCVMSKTDEYRLKLENAQTLDLLKNDDEKYGNKYWYLTLRDYPNEARPETFTIFKKSKMNFNKNSLEIVRKNDGGAFKSPKKILTVYGPNEYLEEKVQKNQKKLHVILPTDDDNFFSMNVIFLTTR